MAGDVQVGKAGESLPEALVVEVTDAEGVGLPDIPVRWTITQGSGRFFDQERPFEEGSTKTDGAGRAAVVLWLGSVGTTVVTASVPSVADVVSFTASATTLVIENGFWGYFLGPTGDVDVRVPLGTTLEWVNYWPSAVHVQAVAVPEGGAAFDSGAIGELERFVFTPSVEGTWRYVWYYLDPEVTEEGSITVDSS